MMEGAPNRPEIASGRREGPAYFPSEPPLIDVGAGFRRIWRHRRLFLIGALIGGLAGIALSLLWQRPYRAHVKIVLRASTTEGPAPNVNDFVTFLANQQFAAETVKEFGLDQPPRSISAAGFLANVLSVDPVRTGNVITLAVALDDPVLAAKVVNGFARRVVQNYRAISQSAATARRDEIGTQVAEAKDRFDRAAGEYTAFRKHTQVELVRRDVEALLNARQGLFNLNIDIAGEQARLESTIREREQRPRVDTVTKSIDSDPAMLAATSEKQGSSALGLQLKSETINETYKELDQQSAQIRATLAGLERRRAALIAALKMDGGELPALNRLYDVETDSNRLDLERHLTEDALTEVSRRFEQARLAALTTPFELSVVDQAMPPDLPSRKMLTFSVLGAILGASVMLIYGLARDALNSGMTLPIR